LLVIATSIIAIAQRHTKVLRLESLKILSLVPTLLTSWGWCSPACEFLLNFPEDVDYFSAELIGEGIEGLVDDEENEQGY